MSEFTTKLAAFCAKLEQEMNALVADKFAILQENAIKEGRRGYNEIGHGIYGARFVRVFTDSGGQRFVKYFVERETGTIFGAKGWKAYNPNHEYGTLDTIDEWDWSDFYAKHKQGKPSLVPKAHRR